MAKNVSFQIFAHTKNLIKTEGQFKGKVVVHNLENTKNIPFNWMQLEIAGRASKMKLCSTTEIFSNDRQR